MSPRVRQWIYSSNSILGCNRVIKPCVSILSAACVPAHMLWCDIISFHLMWRYLFITSLSCMAPFHHAGQFTGQRVCIITYINTTPDLHGWRIDLKTKEVGKFASSELSLCVFLFLLLPLPLFLFLWGSLWVREQTNKSPYLLQDHFFPYKRLLHIHTTIDLFCRLHACRVHKHKRAHMNALKSTNTLQMEGKHLLPN